MRGYQNLGEFARHPNKIQHPIPLTLAVYLYGNSCDKKRNGFGVESLSFERKLQVPALEMCRAPDSNQRVLVCDFKSERLVGNGEKDPVL